MIDGEVYVIDSELCDDVPKIWRDNKKSCNCGIEEKENSVRKAEESHERERESKYTEGF